MPCSIPNGILFGMQWIIGVDEAGRGPLAGPVSVGAVALPVHLNEWSAWGGLKDSKQLSEKKREEWFLRISTGGVRHSVALVSAQVIDAAGIVSAVKNAAAQAVDMLHLSPQEAKVLLDKNIRLPEVWEQEEFIKGDERIPAIALASIVAKVTRDRYMCTLAEALPQYGFERHKGYGTKAHYVALREHGLSSAHRKTFLS